MENKDYTISIYLDTRRAKKNNKYPVKLKIYTSQPQKRKYYPTKFDLTEKEFNSLWENQRLTSGQKAIRRALTAIEDRAEEVAKRIRPFNFEQFEKHLYRKKGDGIKISYHYKNTIQNFVERGQIGTANTYELAEKSIKNYLEVELKQKYETLSFFDISSNWLEHYERYMNDIKGRSLTTVSMYLRTLRTIFNKAIRLNEIEKEYYPFGKDKYQVPATKNVKKALNRTQLKALFNAEPQNQEQQKAKDFWFFSYACNGMNIKDIALLRYKDIENDRFEFYRAKTRITKKQELTPITVYLNDFSKDVIKTYGKEFDSPNSLIFDIIKEYQSPGQKQKAIKNFTRFINQHLKKMCKANQLPDNISTYWARHSFASNFISKGATIVDTMESLGHSNIQTTQNYLRSFDSDTKKEMANSMMDFD